MFSLQNFWQNQSLSQSSCDSFDAAPNTQRQERLSKQHVSSRLTDLKCIYTSSKIFAF